MGFLPEWNQQDGQGVPDMNSLPSFTPYQTTPMGPDMGKINNVYGLNPDGSQGIFPNWNRR